MKNLAKKSTKKAAIADMTPKQFEQALVRHDLRPFQGTVEIGGFSLCIANYGKTRRVQLASLLAVQDKYEAEQEAINAREQEANEAVMEQRHADDEAEATKEYEGYCDKCGQTGLAGCSHASCGGFFIVRSTEAIPVELATSVELDNAAKPGDTYTDPVWGEVSVPSAEPTDTRSGMEVAADKAQFTSAAVAELL